MHQEIYYIIGCLIGSFLTAFFLFPSFIKILERNNLVDVPDDRKIHDREIPGLGGVVVFFAMLIAIGFTVPLVELATHRLFLGTLILVFIVGIRDDISPLKPVLKLLSQLVPIVILFWFENIRIESFYTLGGAEFPFVVSAFITCFTMVIITNSFNLIDGIDGLAGSLSLASLGAFATYFYVTDHMFYAFTLIALAGALVGFLVYNWSPAKIFLGDNGALFIGFILAGLSIVFINDNFGREDPIFRASIGTAMCFIGVPLYDMFRIIILRIRKRKGIMLADKNHMHHLLLNLGLNHSQATILLFSIQIVLILIAYVGKDLTEIYIFGSLAIVLIGFNALILALLRRKTQAEKSGIK